jgi:hypothetical protein
LTFVVAEKFLKTVVVGLKLPRLAIALSSPFGFGCPARIIDASFTFFT